MSNTHEFEASGAEYQTKSRTETKGNDAQRRRGGSTRRRQSSPQAFNGMHRRRRKKFSW